MSTLSPSPPPEQADPVDTGRLDGASPARLIVVLAAIVLYSEIASIQYIMVGAALQKLTKTFASVGGNITWAMIIIGLIGAAATPLLGKLSDIFGKKRFFLICGVLFIAGCLVDALTSDWTVFLIGRGLQAFAIASQMIAYGLIRDLMPRKYIPIGLGATAAGIGFGSILAPLLGGWLVDNFDWRAMFWFLGGFVLLMTPIVMFFVPESKLRVKDRFDPIGAVLLPVGLLLTLLYLDKGQDWGWGRITSYGYLVGGLALLALFFVVETRVSRPIMDMKLLLHPRVSITLVMAMFGTMLIASESFALGYMTQTPNAAQLKETVVGGVLAQAKQTTGISLPPSVVHVVLDPGYGYGSGFSLLQYALHIGVWSGVVALIVGPLGGYLARRFGGRLPAVIAFVVISVMGVAFALASTHYTWQLFFALAVLTGVGFALFYAAVPNLLVEAVPAEQQGISAGMLGVVLNIGAAVALAVFTALLNANPVKARIDVLGHAAVQPIPQVFGDHGYAAGFWVMTGCTVVALVIALFMRHGRKPATGGADVPAD